MAVFARGAGAQRTQQVVASEAFALVEDVGADGAAGQRALADGIQFVALADVEGQRDHFGLPSLDHPADGDG